jgi:hypothetical protein
MLTLIRNVFVIMKLYGSNLTRENNSQSRRPVYGAQNPETQYPETTSHSQNSAGRNRCDV